MPTRVILNCPKCGRVKIYNYLWPDQEPPELECPFCNSQAEVVEATVVPREREPEKLEQVKEKVQEQKEPETYEEYKEVSHGKKKRK